MSLKKKPKIQLTLLIPYIGNVIYSVAGEFDLL